MSFGETADISLLQKKKNPCTNDMFNGIGLS